MFQRWPAPARMVRRLRPFSLLLVALTTVLLFYPQSVFARPALPQSSETTPVAPSREPVVIYFFWGDGCPHCAAQKVYLADLQARYPNVQVRAYEVWHDTVNQQIFRLMAAAYGFEPQGVPTTFIGPRHWVGFADPIRQDMEGMVALCSAVGCPDAGAGIVPGVPAATPTTQAPSPAPAQVAQLPAGGETAAELLAPEVLPAAAGTIQLPFFGTVNLAGQSLLVSTAIIAFVDGFNPCSLWVLSVLLALTLHTGSRRKVLVVGLVFLTVTSLVYAIFIAGLFTMFTVLSFVGWLQVLVALVALFFAVVNIKDYFWYRQGISFTIADEKKPGLYAQMRRVLDAGHSWWGLVSATVVLAAGVSLVEFSCTAGFPVLWTNLLTAQSATASEFGWLLLLYMLIYQMDEMAIFLVAVLTLRASRLEEKHGRILKLVGGMLMLVLAAVMIYQPALMNELDSALLIFGVALVATGAILLVHRVILPRFGVYIGSELQPAKTALKTGVKSGKPLHRAHRRSG